MKTIFKSVIASAVIMLAGCRPSSLPPSPTTDTSRLDSMAQRDPQFADIAARVKLFYQALQKKDWDTTYDMRTADFRQDVTKTFYLKQISDAGKHWSLDSYKILNIASQGGTDGQNAAQLIMEFQEGGLHSYYCAVWKKENGTWLCEEPGLNGLALLHSTRIHDW